MDDMEEYIFDEDGNPLRCPYSETENVFADEEDRKDIFHIKGDGYDVTLSLARGLVTWSNVNPSGKKKGIFKKQSKHVDQHTVMLRDVLSVEVITMSCEQQLSWKKKGIFKKQSKHVDQHTVMLRDVFGVEVKRKKTSANAPEGKDGICMGFNLHVTNVFGPNILHDRVILFEHPSEALCNAYVTKIGSFIDEMHQRPKSIKLFLQPYAGPPGKAKPLYKHKVLPLFQAADVHVDCVEVEHNEHIKQEMVHINLDDYDCIVAMGGDGTVNQVLNGLLSNSQKLRDLEPKPGFTPVRARVPLGIIPAGTTNDIVRSIHGTEDVVTAVLHIIIGRRFATDVCSMYKEDKFYEWFFNAQYGFSGNVLFYRHRYKSMGKRTLEPGIIKALTKAKFRSYKCDIEYIPADTKVPPNRQYQPCFKGCDVCWNEKVTDGDEVIQDLVQPFDPLAESHDSDTYVDLAAHEDNPWKAMKGDYLNVGLFATPGRCELAPRGLSEFTHLNDGAIDLVLIKDCPRKQFIRVLKRLANSKNAFDFDFVEVIRVKEVRFKLRLAIGFNYSDTKFSEIEYEIERQERMNNAVTKSMDILEIDDISDDEDTIPTNGKSTPTETVQSRSSPAGNKPKPFLRSKSFQPNAVKNLKRTNTETSIDMVQDLSSLDSDSDEDEDSEGEDAGQIVSISSNGVRTVKSASAASQNLVGPQYRITFAEADRAKRRKRALKKEEKKKKREMSKGRALWNVDNEMINEDTLEFRVHHGLLTIYGIGVSSDTVLNDSSIMCLPRI